VPICLTLVFHFDLKFYGVWYATILSSWFIATCYQLLLTYADWERAVEICSHRCENQQHHLEDGDWEDDSVELNDQELEDGYMSFHSKQSYNSKWSKSSKSY
jgi:hypothetical protein